MLINVIGVIQVNQEQEKIYMDLGVHKLLIIQVLEKLVQMVGIMKLNHQGIVIMLLMFFNLAQEPDIILKLCGLTLIKLGVVFHNQRTLTDIGLLIWFVNINNQVIMGVKLFIKQVLQLVLVHQEQNQMGVILAYVQEEQ